MRSISQSTLASVVVIHGLIGVTSIAIPKGIGHCMNTIKYHFRGYGPFDAVTGPAKKM